jgi:adenylate cyclase class IV
MSKEIEKNYYNFFTKELNELKNNLQKINAKYIGSYLFMIYECMHNNFHVRLRDEIRKKTFTIKHNNNSKYETEHEVNIGDISMMKNMLKLLDIDLNITGNKVREIYNYKNSEIAIDYIFGIANFVQIESPNEKELNKIAQELQISDKIIKPDVIKNYGIDKEELKKIGPPTFKKIKKIQKLVTKNKNEHNELIKIQKEAYKKSKKY